MAQDYQKLPVVEQMVNREEAAWVNPKLVPFAESKLDISMADIEDAEARLLRFAPFIMKCFPETVETKGIIESALTPIPKMQVQLAKKYGSEISGKLFLKEDSHLAIAGSIKARGGIYEVLKHTEELAMEAGFLQKGDDYAKLAEPKYREFFSRYTVQVGSTGNLGLSIGIASAAVGYHVIVHMSADAKQWKKDMLRSHGVTVMEYESDYSEAVKEGRKKSDADPKSYFVDDENSVNLFMGYAVAAKRLQKQLEEQNVTVDANHPLFVYLPCGVGGAPGGVMFGLKALWGDSVHCFFVEPVDAPAMLLGMATGLHHAICVQDVGLSGLTHADGLAVGRPSGFVGKVADPLLSGIFTLKDKWLYEYMRDLLETEDIFIEPSACAAFAGVTAFEKSKEIQTYVKAHGLADKMQNATHLAWATGGSLVPHAIRAEYVKTHLDD